MIEQRSVLRVAVGLLVLPLVAAAQPPPKRVQVGLLSGFFPSVREEAFRRGLRDLGYVEGQNLAIRSRYAEGRFAKLPELAADLVRLDVDARTRDSAVGPFPGDEVIR